METTIIAQAAVADGKGGFTIAPTEVSPPAEGEVVVKMKAAGLCHTDHDSLSWGKPIVMGHEGAGEVFAVGNGVTDFQLGDQVILNWATPCYSCFQCERGNEHICENNSPVVAGGNGFTPGHAHLEGTRWQGQPIERS
ncbi:MAG: alcohol dehydrogenase catalytic domain-containing protein, partial [Bacteroidota bacterium]